MKRILLALALTTSPACFVDSDVAEDPESAETRISKSGGDWCDGICQRIVDCPVGECVCSEDTCDCPQPLDMPTCLQGCAQFLDTFVDRGEACAEAGLEQMSCLDNTSCEQLSAGGICGAEDVPPACAGSTPGDISCDIDGGSSVSPGATTPAECTLDFVLCSDGHDYGVSCVQEEGELYRICSCSTDQQVTHTFNLQGLACPSEYDVNVGCGFGLALSSNNVPPPGECFGAAGSDFPQSGQSFGCDSEYHCAAGVYAISCSLEAGYPSCRCFFEGEQVQTFLVPDGMCPGNGEAEDVARINAGCGWNITRGP